MSDHDRSPSAEEIRADIERTRERLGDTVEALGAHLNPSLLKARVKDSVREATIGRAKTMARNARDKAEESGRGLVRTIRDNPLPVAMIAGGIGWLLFGRRRQESERVEQWDYPGEIASGVQATSDVGAASASAGATGTAGAGAAPVTGELDDYSRGFPDLEEQDHGVAARARAAGDRVASTARSAGESVAAGAKAAGERVVSGARAAGDRVASGARAARERVVATSSQLAHTVADRARAGGHRVEETYQENPVVLGAVAAAVGLAIGLTLPVSEKEAELLGGKRDELVDKAREAISDTTEKVRSAADRVIPEVGATIKEVARQEGLAG